MAEGLMFETRTPKQAVAAKRAALFAHRGRDCADALKRYAGEPRYPQRPGRDNPVRAAVNAYFAEYRTLGTPETMPES